MREEAAGTSGQSAVTLRLLVPFVASPLWPSISMPTDASEFVLVGKVVAYFAVERFFQRVS